MQGVPITIALVVAAPLCWGVIAAKPPRIAFLQLSAMRPNGGFAEEKGIIGSVFIPYCSGGKPSTCLRVVWRGS